MKRTLIAGAAILAIAGCGGDDKSSDDAGASQLPPNAVRIVASQVTDTKGPFRSFHTEKDLRPASVEIKQQPAKGTSHDHIFLTPRAKTAEEETGPMILDWKGRLQWFQPNPGRVTVDLNSQSYNGRTVLTWSERPYFENSADIYKGEAEDLYDVIADHNYEEIMKVRVQGDGARTDLHEFALSNDGTAFLVGFRNMPYDLSAVGGPEDGALIDGLVQEIDLETGKVLFDWSAIEHVPITDSMFPVPPGGNGWDYFHVNSVTEDTDGNLLISARHTSAVYKLDRKTGEIIWQLGGKKSDFDVAKDARFYYQHDAQRSPNGKLMVFNNGASERDHRQDRTSVLELNVDEKARKATLATRIVHDPPFLAASQGNARTLRNGNIFVGWGDAPVFSEYSADGKQLFDAQLSEPAHHSYRAFKGPWVGKPDGRPAVVADRLSSRTLAFVSWNGATEVAHWRVRGGPGESSMKILGAAPWKGFETKLEIAATPEVLQIEALDADGKVLGKSELVRPGG